MIDHDPGPLLGVTDQAFSLDQSSRPASDSSKVDILRRIQQLWAQSSEAKRLILAEWVLKAYLQHLEAETINHQNNSKDALAE
jgi:hypothetical protein